MHSVEADARGLWILLQNGVPGEVFVLRFGSLDRYFEWLFS